MAEFAPVGSLHHLQKLDEAKVLGDYHLLLAHSVLEDQVGWRTFYEGIRSQDRDPFVIMDNSLVELGYSIGWDSVLEAYDVVGATCVVLPDVLSNGPDTLQGSYRAAIELWEKRPTVATMYVTQGMSLDEIVFQARMFSTLPNVRYLSVPRVFEDTVGQRWRAAMFAHQASKLPIHLLGFSENVEADVQASRIEGVMGIDSAVPLREGLEGRPWKIGDTVGPRKAGYLEDTSWHMQAADNVLEFRNEVR